jgi:exopolysaccharide biosynthesis polyprenyl glycosylphosphotransferase
MLGIGQIFSLAFDAILINVGIVIAFLIRFKGSLPETNFEAYQTMFIPFTLIMLLGIYAFGLQNWRKIDDIQNNVFKAISFGTLTIMAVTYASRNIAAAFPTSVFGISWIINILLLTGWRVIAKEVYRPIKKVLIVGTGERAKAVEAEINRHPHAGYELIGFIGEKTKDKNPNILGGYDDLIKIVEDKKIDEVIVTIPHTSNPKLWDTILNYEDKIKFKTIPDIYEAVISKIGSIQIEAVPLIELSLDPISGWNRTIKRLGDIIISFIVLVLFLPIFPIIMILIKLDSKGPVFFRQERVGKDGKIYQICKFRSMYVGAEDQTGPVLATPNDERITKFGKKLRQWRVDELPNLLNVLRGHMSLVGPRPERPEFVDRFKKTIPGYQLRFKVRPGITGLAQINAPYDVPAQIKFLYDILYINNYTLFLDFKIMLRTLLVILRKEGAQ